MRLRPAHLAAVLLPAALGAQGTPSDYARASQLPQQFRGLVVNVAERPTWLDADRFWYRKTVPRGHEFVLVTVSTAAKSSPFDATRLATALNAVTRGDATARTLPFSEFSFDGTRAVRVTVAGVVYNCTLAEYICTRTGAAPSTPAGARGAAVPAFDHEHSALFDDDLANAAAGEGPWMPNDGHDAEVLAQRATTLPLFLQPRAQPADSGGVRSPDGRYELYINNYNLWIRPVVRRGASDSAAPAPRDSAGPANAPIQLTRDGTEGRAYVLGGGQGRGALWSPDSRKIAAFRVTPGYQRMVRYIESSPADQLQPKWSERLYQKPGDVVTRRDPVLIDVATQRVIAINQERFPNAYAITALKWWRDSRAFTFEYNQRGHQVYRVIEVDAATGAVRALVSEEPKTFVSYRPAADELSGSGSYWRYDLADGRGLLWMSERDGWKQLYHVDNSTGKAPRRITSGSWVVRNVHSVDTLAQRIWFVGNGRDAQQDPYFTKYYRVNFDGTGLLAFTPEDGNHAVTWSPDTTYYVDTWQRPDLPPVSVLKRVRDQAVVMELERGDANALVAAGYHMAEPFVAKARDGITDIWGVIVKPTNFDPAKTYPVIEQIYAGPQGSFAPKTFQVTSATRTLAEHGFIVVQLDGMGTANRSKAFHDVAWQNLGDAGFPDRILWHRAVAAKYSWYDTTRVGVYGGSAGGQNAMGALLFHPEFYKVAFSSVGCHDNRMDKIWWNEQWMGWPVDAHYDRASNVVNAAKLQGKLMLVVGELDTNVDPASTMQVVNALVRAQKDFELIVLPGQGHTNGGPYGVRRMTDFFVRNLIGVTTPDRNAASRP